ncbi:hypothetical protein H1R16_04450 [Marnyiella aurantia]|uniref:DUF6705 domain-containing protein n=1 Tax=Marnyiella aurantia TaxID=2758037 RepID=A0A7D7QFB2_9FLAO|nr:DUF6705 family protein [Marnyiella aurantia]MBA5247508.1 hypothetical protein [Marnyiella aurantia]QMS99261.1 hypothetical protein H1R16_04450 [Marnyiella aurantia]
MKKLLYLALFLICIACKAQTVAFNTSLDDIPDGAYVKDLNNELDPFIGEYKVTYEGRETTLFISKVSQKPIAYGNKNYFQDVLIVKFIVKNFSGTVLQDTQNIATTTNEIESITFIPQIQSLGFSYSGNNCSIGNGLIYMKKISPTQISWTYNPQTTAIDDVSCPPNVDKKIYLPDTKDLIFTKQ